MLTVDDVDTTGREGDGSVGTQDAEATDAADARRIDSEEDCVGAVGAAAPVAVAAGCCTDDVDARGGGDNGAAAGVDVEGRGECAAEAGEDGEDGEEGEDEEEDDELTDEEEDVESREEEVLDREGD